MIRVLVCGEGIHDIGTTGPGREDGWLQPLLRKLAGNDLEIVTVRRQQLYIASSCPGMTDWCAGDVIRRD